MSRRGSSIKLLAARRIGTRANPVPDFAADNLTSLEDAHMSKRNPSRTENAVCAASNSNRTRMTGKKWSEKVQELEQENASLKAQLEELKKEHNDELPRLRRELNRAQAQRQEIQASRTFLNTTDAVSDADIVGMVKSLNYEIHQAAAFFAASVTYDFSRDPSRYEDSYVSSLRQILGDVAYDALLLRTDPDNHVSNVQHAIQACLIVWCQQVIELWCFSEEENQMLRSYFAEPPAIARTWRALVRQITKISSYQNNMERSIASLSNEVCSVLALAGGTMQTLDIAASTRDIFLAILDHCCKLDGAIEGMRSADVRIYVPVTGIVYHAESMYDVDGGSQGPDVDSQPYSGNQHIALTCYMGVCKAREEAGCVFQQVMLKAGVQMASTLASLSPQTKIPYNLLPTQFLSRTHCLERRIRIQLM